MPKTVEDALRIDKENGDDRWAKATKKEMDKVYVAFDIKERGDKPPVGHQMIGVHMIFDVKMENFQFKARLVANGNETGTPASLTYASVVSRESVRIALTMAALNGLQVKTSDIENAYLTAPTDEELYTILGSEFGKDKGKVGVTIRALYGTKSAGASFRNHLADCMLSNISPRIIMVENSRRNTPHPRFRVATDQNWISALSLNQKKQRITNPR